MANGREFVERLYTAQREPGCRPDGMGAREAVAHIDAQFEELLQPERLSAATMSQYGAQADAFFREVVRHRVVWTLRDDGGFPAPRNQDGQRAMPFWSSKARVERLIRGAAQFHGFVADCVPLEEWRERWLVGLERDRLLVGLNWTGQRGTGFDVEPSSVRARLDAVDG